MEMRVIGMTMGKVNNQFVTYHPAFSSFSILTAPDKIRTESKTYRYITITYIHTKQKGKVLIKEVIVWTGLEWRRQN